MFKKNKKEDLGWCIWKKDVGTILEGNQLFSSDTNKNGSKKFRQCSFKDAYKIISDTHNLYEDHTFNNKIKLHIDYDLKEFFTSCLQRDKKANKIIDIVVRLTNELLGIENSKIIVLMSETLDKLSLHFIWTEVLFNNIVSMKLFFLQNEELCNIIDMSVYKRGAFRVLDCNKFGKNNLLRYYKSFNYDKPDDYNFFLDSCVTFIRESDNYKTIEMPDIMHNYKTIKRNIHNVDITRNNNYCYENVNFHMVKLAVSKVDLTNYDKWLIVGFCMKDLYNSVESDKEVIYNIFDNESKKYDNYNEIDNLNKWENLDPLVDINYLFVLAGIDYYIQPKYDIPSIMFDYSKYNNIYVQDSKWIDVNEDVLKHWVDNYKKIFLKSPTGTGKTTILKKLLKFNKVNNIISITSRVNLAGEHIKNIDLKFYKKLDNVAIKKYDKLVIQLESLYKVDYQKFKGGVVILDEINSLLSHFRSPTLNNSRKDNYLYFCEIIQNASLVICMDADLSGWNIDFINMINKQNDKIHECKSNIELKDDLKLINVSNKDYVIYHNVCKNKKGVKSTFFKSEQKIINKMIECIKKKKYFVACFDSLSYMKHIIGILSHHKEFLDNLLEYSSEIDYGTIDTMTWINKFVFFTPTIIYGIDFSHCKVDVFSFIKYSHLNSLQIYQMISRVRDIDNVYIYCHDDNNYLKYYSVDSVRIETDTLEKYFNVISKDFINDFEIDDKPYKLMYYNHTFIDNILKSNLKYYLISHMEYIGFDVITDYEEIDVVKIKPVKLPIPEKVLDNQTRIINLLGLDKDNLTDFHKKLISGDKKLVEHFNLKMFVKNELNDKLYNSISKNLNIELAKSNITKLITFKNILSKIFCIDDIKNINKDCCKNFGKTIKNPWLKDNIENIKNLFRLRGKAYDNIVSENVDFYSVYRMMITIAKNLFGDDLFSEERIMINKVNYRYSITNLKIFEKHEELFYKKNNNTNFID